MSGELQVRGYRESRYERPDRPWVCGWAREGRPCPLGPDAAGRCVTTHECLPSRRGDRWECGRHPAFGGRCPEGPLPDGSCCHPIPPCKPEPSLRARRGRLSRWTSGIALAAVVLLAGGDSGRRFLSPGPVSSAHSFFEGQCTSCHATAAAGLLGHGTTVAAEAFEGSDSERCLTCHELGASALLAHSLPAERLAADRAVPEETPGQASAGMALALARALGGGVAEGGATLPCATCHVEHGGREADLRALGNAQCQLCHSRAFPSLARGHPPLGGYPYERRTPIVFSHVTHQTRHFPESERDFACAGCHRPDAALRRMDLAPFESACAGCHADDVRSEILRSGEKGVAFLSLPTLDRNSLDAPELAPVGHWPKSRRIEPSPFAELLLLGGDELSPGALEILAGLDPAKLRRASLEDREIVVRYAWALKALVHDLAQHGHEGLRARLEGVLERRLSDGELSDLAGQLNPEALERAARAWLPQLDAELEARTAAAGDEAGEALREALSAIGESPEDAVSRDLSDREREEWVRSGGWFATGRGASLRYRSRGHADPFLRAWLDLSSSALRMDGEASSSPRARAREAAAARVFALLTKSKAPGSCVKCHSVDAATPPDEGAGRGRFVHWGPRRSSTPSPTTRFTHGPHRKLGAGDACARCHLREEKDVELASQELDALYEGTSTARDGRSDFGPMETALCASCHQPRAAGDACVSCHGYHFSERAEAM